MKSNMAQETSLAPVYSTTNGAVYKCSCCEVIQVEYRIYAFCLHPIRYVQLASDLQTISQQKKADAKRYAINFDYERVSVICSDEEIEELCRLFVGAADNLELSKKIEVGQAKSVMVTPYKGVSVFATVDPVCKTPLPLVSVYRTAVGEASFCPLWGVVKLNFGDIEIFQDLYEIHEFYGFLQRFIEEEIQLRKSKKNKYRLRFVSGELVLVLPRKDLLQLYMLIRGCVENLSPGSPIWFNRN